MERVAVDDAPSDVEEAGVDRHRLSERLGTAALALNRYRVAPGGALPAGLHAHADQEEVFYVLAGTATFETLAPTDDENRAGGGGSDEASHESADAVDVNDATDADDAADESGRATADAGDTGERGDVAVRAGEAVRFAPGEFQSGRNDGSEPLVVLAVGAPRESADLRFPAACPDCGRGEMRLTTADGPRFVCPDCGAARVPTPCPDCGGEDLRFRRDDAARTVVRCRDCDATYPTPPVRGEW